MDKSILTDILVDEAAKASHQQEYGEKKKIEGSMLVELPVFRGDDGFFVELARLTGQAETTKPLPPLSVAQINYSETVPDQIKAWHYHLKQDEIWLIPPTTKLIVGLLDLRRSSPTKNQVLRYSLGQGKMQALLIPRGVAHGLSNPYPQPAGLFYLVSNTFDGTDEWRLPFDFSVGKEFWQIQTG
ncbi:MAG: dTDP-4-dehydrorhamnose 3,5-epimerase family protein [Deltaproteobacteria bacterium]|nr:dTDP-4-dehydrorhamnose 3,5-epimerase family protein [Deltaproteobacteria bacterium]